MSKKTDINTLKSLNMHLTLDQVAALLQVSKETVRREIARNAFREVVYLAGKTVRIPADVFAEYVSQRTVRAAS